MARRIGTADRTVDVQKLLSDGADLGRVACNPADAWTFESIDKAGVIGGPHTNAAMGVMLLVVLSSTGVKLSKVAILLGVGRSGR